MDSNQFKTTQKVPDHVTFQVTCLYGPQNQSTLFFPKRNQKTGKVPIYAPQIDGRVSDRVVKGVHILPEHPNTQNKIVKADDPNAKEFNKKIARASEDLRVAVK